MKNTTKEESWRERCIRLILTEPEAKGFRAVTVSEDPAILLDLKGMGYVNGSEMIDVNGRVIEFRTTGATLAGLLFAEDQQQILAERSFWGRIKGGSGLFIGWLVGVITSVLIHYLTNNG